MQAQFAQATKNVAFGVGQIDLSGTGSKLTKQFNSLGQQIRESTGAVEDDDITELPAEYKALENKVDALRLAHVSMLKVTKAYESETYDYPANINESLGELSQNVAHSLTFWAAAATKGTNLPQPTVAEKAPEQHKTFAHALSRAAAGGAMEITGGGTTSGLLEKSLQAYAVAQDKIGNARLEQDRTIGRQFVTPWSTTLNFQIQAAMKSRANVRSARCAVEATSRRFMGTIN